MNQTEFNLGGDGAKQFALEGTHGQADVNSKNSISILVDLALPGVDSSTLHKIRSSFEGLSLLADYAINEPNNSAKNVSKWFFSVQSKATERFRDRLKAIYFPIYLSDTQKFGKLFSLNDYVQFNSSATKNSKNLIEHTFVHGVGRFYRFLLDQLKTPKDRESLAEFLLKLPSDCPNHLFFDGPKASKGEWNLPLSLRKTHNPDLIQLACQAAEVKLMKRAHENLEKFFILNDLKTFACEVPVWLQPNDFTDYNIKFGTDKCITGHIDILRLGDNGRIEVWDYKPNAEQETKAAQQVLLYMFMLSKRINISMDNIAGGYFDEHAAFSVSQT